MDWLIVVIAIGLFLIAGAILSFSNRATINELKREIKALQAHINLQARQIGRLNSLISGKTVDALPSEETPVAEEPEVHSEPVVAEDIKMQPGEPLGTIASVKSACNQPGLSSKPQPVATAKSTPSFNFDEFIKGNGLLWLGGLVLAIGGIFLARYSIEAGLLSPELRVLLGTVFGVVLVSSAEYLSRHRERFHVHSPYVCASLASGGVITCFAMALVAYDYYHFINAQVAFGLLAVVSLISTSLALRFGPMLAWIGVIGAYTVPVLVNTGSNNVAALLLYTAFVSASAIWISQTVNQSKLWWLSFVANTVWLFMSVAMANPSHYYAILLFVLVSVYLYVLSDIMGWRLTASMTSALPVRTLLMPRKEHSGIVLPLLALCGFLTISGAPWQLVVSSLVVSALCAIVPVRYSALDSWPYLALLFLLFAFTQLPEPLDYSDNLFPFRSGYLFAQLAGWGMLAYSALMFRLWQRAAYLLLMVLGPMSLFAISYALSPDEAGLYLYPIWAIELALMAIGSSILAARTSVPLLQITLSILANTCITLCLTMLLDAATLTLAIAVQIGVMSYLSWKLRVQLPDWLYKAALAVVTVRLTLAPWLSTYEGEQILGLHWTLVVYPLVLAIIWFSRYYNGSADFKRWLEGAFLHVLALLVTTETSYLLVGRYPDFLALTFHEAILLAMNWLLLSAVYLWRAGTAHHTARLYRLFALLLVAGAGILHIDVSFARNPFMAEVNTGDGLLINWLLLLWAVPASILLTAERQGLTPDRVKVLIHLLCGLLGFMYINGLIRGAFHNGALILNGNVEQAELYTYSIIWLLIATATVFIGQHYKRMRLRNIGFGVLALVLLKAFLIDMAHLEGLYRAISFIGLGLSLVGIGWLFQKLSAEAQQEQA